MFNMAGITVTKNTPNNKIGPEVSQSVYYINTLQSLRVSANRKPKI